ncbi:hypothetical protein [Paenibacillus radicis (ex Xue et al. 2023)]|uniref:DUF4367 domain-containing protein n=1 Tax=Paenibacillus radicis (ex Xue et al. 2023) TaxID=2972489 RepID=A0ABT1YM88_9BACL|nr:hypothetical protein [Paenibacillus radicis (ex Xue et al. 2023)]MCR8634286.1 hypothetical protein [Paenibacillus radicis (ex Xue et al. 2023)]
MSNQPKDEQMLTDQAWAKLQEKLAKEPRSLQWAQLERNSAARASSLQGDRSIQPLPNGLHSETMHNSEWNQTPSMEKEAPVKTRKGFAQWIQKRRKLVGTATAAALLVIIVSTTAGNEALAAILHKFRMQEMAVVQQDDLQMILNGAFRDDKTREAINKFGTFTQKNGTPRNEPISAEEAKQLMNGKLLLPKQAKTDKFNVSPSNTITFQMNVSEVNSAMKRLGAKKLLPASVDGKPITLELGPSIHASFKSGEGKGQETSYWMSQQPVPELTVDPSIPIAEAMEAVLDFPLLPENLKQAMQTTNMLKGGSVPLPVISNQKMEQIKVEGIPVLVKKQGDERNRYYSAYWVQDGHLLELGAQGNAITQDKLIAQIKELIHP